MKWKILFITAMMPLCAELNFRAGPGVTPFFPLPAVTVGLDSVSKHVAFGSTFQVVPSIHAPVSYVGVHAVPLFRPTQNTYCGIGVGGGVTSILPSANIEALIGYKGSSGTGCQFSVTEPVLYPLEMPWSLPIPGFSLTFNKTF